MFRTVFPSVIRSSRLYIQQQTDNSICLLLCVQSWTPDDGRKDRPKNSKINKFDTLVYLVGFAIGIILWRTGLWMSKTIGIKIGEMSEQNTCAPHFRGHIPFEGIVTDANTRYFRTIDSSTFRPAAMDRKMASGSLATFCTNSSTIRQSGTISAFHATKKQTNKHVSFTHRCSTFASCFYQVCIT